MCVHGLDLILKGIQIVLSEQDPEELEINVPGYEDQEGYSYSFKIKGQESWDYMRKSPEFSKEKWKKLERNKNAELQKVINGNDKKKIIKVNNIKTKR